MDPRYAPLMSKARRSLRAAEDLSRQRDYDFAVSRAYYGMFYAAEAALLSRDLAFSKHRGIISGFYHAFVESGVFPREFHTYLRIAFESRNTADYQVDKLISASDADRIIVQAREFIEAIDAYLQRATQ